MNKLRVFNTPQTPKASETAVALLPIAPERFPNRPRPTACRETVAGHCLIPVAMLCQESTQAITIGSTTARTHRRPQSDPQSPDRPSCPPTTIYEYEMRSPRFRRNWKFARLQIHPTKYIEVSDRLSNFFRLKRRLSLDLPRQHCLKNVDFGE